MIIDVTVTARPTETATPDGKDIKNVSVTVARIPQKK